jgi:uncharacterized repeat protein (TIGR01451 family)
MKGFRLFFAVFLLMGHAVFAQQSPSIQYFSVLQPANLVQFSVQGEGTHSAATFGGDLSNSVIIGEVILPTTDSVFCTGDGTNMTGKIAILRRGVCEFGLKTLNAQNQGAIAVIIENTADSVVSMAAGTVGAQVTIPVIMIKSSLGQALRAAYNAGETVVVSMGNAPSAGFTLIEGFVRADDNNDCTPQPTETGSKNWPVGITSNQGNMSLYSTDATGHFQAYVSPSGAPFVVTAIPPASAWEVCNNQIEVTGAAGETVQVDFSVESTSSCTELEATISSGIMRRCFDIPFYVEVCNNGTETAENAYAIVTLPEEMEPASAASLPFTVVSEDVYRFELGNLAPLECINFNLVAENDCDSTILGQTLCYSVHAFPDTDCQQPLPQWNGASVNVTATCTGNEVLFKITNIGTAPMNAANDYIVIQDHVMYMMTPFELDAGETITVPLPADGSTWRLEAEQVAYHPVPGNPSKTIEGCTTSSTFTTGSFTMFPLYDPGSAQDEECKEVIGAYDPNDKQGFPKGWGELQLIRPNVPIDYLIRFQNTGTDTAFTVVIRDTLPAALDPMSIRHLKSSHNFTYSVEKGNLLTFRFDQIKLVDSFTNEPGSHGFISFRINQQPDNAFGTFIDNRAGIYFDFNPPIITNIAHHEVGEVIGIVPVLDVPTSVVPEIFPNPAVATTHLRLKDQSFDQARWDLVNAQGQTIANGRVQSGTIQLSGQTPSGIHYLYLTKNNGQRYAVKVVMR